MCRILQNGGHPGHVVVVYEVKQVLALIQGPVLRAKLAQERVGDLKEIEAIQAGVKSFVALVVGGGMKHRVTQNAVIVPTQDFTY